MHEHIEQLDEAAIQRWYAERWPAPQQSGRRNPDEGIWNDLKRVSVSSGAR